MKNLRRFLFVVISFFFSLPTAFSQLEERYKIISNEAEVPKFELTVNPFDFMSMKGICMGAGVNIKMRPISRIGVDARFRSMLYTNPYRQDYDGTDEDKSRFKSMGGINTSVVGEFIWRKKGLLMPNRKFLLSRSTETTGYNRTTTNTKYIPIKHNELVERTLRGGLLYDNFPTDDNTLSAASFAFGVGKRNTNTVQVDVNGQPSKQSNYFQYIFELMIGVPQYADPSIVDENYTAGFRFIMERQWKAKNAKEVRGWKNLDITLEVGSRPGAITSFAMTVGIPAMSIGNNPVREGMKYKEIKEPKRFIGKFLRFI